MISIELIEKLAKIVAIFIGGAWVYFKTIRGRTFIPRLQPQVSGELKLENGHQYLLIKAQVENVGSSIARIKEEGTALKISARSAFGEDDAIMDLYTETETAFPAFDITKGQSIALEPVTKFYFEELIEIPKNKYDAFKIELRVSAFRGGILSKKDRKWRAFTVILANTNNNSEEQKE